MNLRPEYLSVMQAPSREALRTELVRFAKAEGFDFVGAMVVLDRPGGMPEFVGLSNTPSQYVDAFHDPASAQRDPVMQHCKRCSVPVVWDQQTYAGAGAGDLWEEQAAFGYRTGISLALHLPHGRHFALGMERDRALPRDATQVTRWAAELQLYAVHAMEAAMQLLVQPAHRPPVPALAPRELECLKWSMEGKTAWETGTILGLTERTVVHYLRNAARKLGCVNKQHAIARALRSGLVS
jgi:DNA-binding CsgD family transcriptional regulator